MKKQLTKEQFLNDVKDHQIKILKEDGVYRHVRFKKPNDVSMWFDLITTPNRLLYTGDMGTFVFSRIEDMFRFFRSGSGELQPNFGYWGEKCISESRHDGGCYEFSLDEFKKCVIEHTLSMLDKYAESELTEEEHDEISDLLECCDEYEAIEAVRNHKADLIPFDDFFEYSFTKASLRYLWCCYAIQWGIMQYDKAKMVEK